MPLQVQVHFTFRSVQTEKMLYILTMATLRCWWEQNVKMLTCFLTENSSTSLKFVV